MYFIFSFISNKSQSNPMWNKFEIIANNKIAMGVHASLILFEISVL